jgi:hypothetical protein
MPTARSLPLSAALVLIACSKSPPPPPAASEPAKAPTAVPADPPAAPAASPAAPAAPAAAPAPAAAAAAPADGDEACARVVVIAYKGAQPPTAGVTRDKARAEEEARGYLDKLKAGSNFGAMARGHSDAPTSGARNGYLGTFKRADWPAMHAPVRDAVYNLAVGAFADAPVEAPYGYVVLQRCPVEKARSRHILIRYKDAERAPATITRSKAEAKTLARDLLAQLRKGADFAELAKTKSEDGSAERGGDIGIQSRGLLAPAYDNALFELKPGQQTQVVETAMGFHIIERLPD